MQLVSAANWLLDCVKASLHPAALAKSSPWGWAAAVLTHRLMASLFNILFRAILLLLSIMVRSPGTQGGIQAFHNDCAKEGAPEFTCTVGKEMVQFLEIVTMPAPACTTANATGFWEKLPCYNAMDVVPIQDFESLEDVGAWLYCNLYDPFNCNTSFPFLGILPGQSAERMQLSLQRHAAALEMFSGSFYLMLQLRNLMRIYATLVSVLFSSVAALVFEIAVLLTSPLVLSLFAISVLKEYRRNPRSLLAIAAHVYGKFWEDGNE